MDDILRKLTRGVKYGPGTFGRGNFANATLPSAGTRTNPQLFHDEVLSGRGAKRKRDVEATGQRSDDDWSDDPFMTEAERRSRQEAQKEKERHNGTQKATREPRQKQPELLDDDECRRVLRSHRLKLAILTNDRIAKSKAKKKSKNKTSVAPVKEEKVQIYPQPLTSFDDLRDVYGVSHRLCDNLQRLGYQIPTEVQMGSLPLLLRPEIALSKSKDPGSLAGAGLAPDLLAVAPTGSGKTLSFLIPALNEIMRSRAGSENKKEHVLRAVVVAPTRELAAQIVNEAKKISLDTGVKIVAMRKGMRVAAQNTESGREEENGDLDDESANADDSDEEEEEDDDDEKFDKPAKPMPLTRADVLVTTPLLLLNSLSQKSSARANLPTVQSLILDEADVLLDPLFREQTLGIWSACIHPSLRVTFWSATMGSNIETLAMEQLASRHGSRRADSSTPAQPQALVRLVVGLKDTAVPNVSHRLIYAATEQGKLLALRQLLHPSSSSTDPNDPSAVPLRPPFLVFTQTIDRAASLAEELRYDIGPSVPQSSSSSAAAVPLRSRNPTDGGDDPLLVPRIAALHSGLTPSQRSRVVSRFRAGQVWVLVTTDVLARGIDFAGVNGVVNYDVPTSAAAYVHRAGRTGRAGRSGGVCVTLYTEDDVPYVRSVVVGVVAASERQAAAAAGKTGGEGAATAAPSGGVLATHKWLLDALPKVSKRDRQRLKQRGVESRRSTGGAATGKAAITSKSSWERRKENNRKGAIEASKRRKRMEGGGPDGKGVRGSALDEDEWSGFGD